MSDGNNNNGNGNGSKWSFERIILIALLGGNVTLGGILGLGGDDPAHPQPQPAPIEQPVPVTETCDFKLLVCQWEVNALNEKVEELKKENSDLERAIDSFSR